jgi:hypothetical protein
MRVIISANTKEEKFSCGEEVKAGPTSRGGNISRKVTVILAMPKEVA